VAWRELADCSLALLSPPYGGRRYPN